MEQFKSLGLSQWLCKALQNFGIKTPSNIQREAIPAILSQNRPNVFACSRTGSGKSLAFVLPIVETLVKDPRPYFALILSPTRELASQTFEMIQALTVNTFSVKCLLIIGGQNEEAQGLWFGKPNIVVATPGRLLDHLTNRNFLDVCGDIDLMKFDVLVLDEADQLISSSFCHQLREILDFFDEISQRNGHRRQTLLFSATLTHALEKLQQIISQKESESKPLMINLLPTIDVIKKELATNPNLDQRYILCPEALKVVYLVELILDLQFKQTIIFCRSKKEAKRIHKVLCSLGFDGPEFKLNPVLLNADLQQHIRFAALDTFRSLKSRILVTTDLANRGLDLPQVDLVINFDCPQSAVVYVHRVGRTCRKPDFRYEQQQSIIISQSNNEQQEDSDSDEEKKTRKINDFHKKNQNALRPKKLSENDVIEPSHYLGKSITVITNHDIERFKAIELFIGLKMKEEEIDEKNLTNIIKQVSIAIKEAEIRLEKEDQESRHLQNKRARNRFKKQDKRLKTM